jgi:hypothetical protein
MRVKGTPLAEVRFQIPMSWLRLAELIERYEPRFIRKVGFPGKYADSLEALLLAVEELFNSGPEYSDRSGAEELLAALKDTNKLAELTEETSDRCAQLATSIKSKSKLLEMEIEGWLEENGERDYDSPESDERVPAGGFDLEEFLEDL